MLKIGITCGDVNGIGPEIIFKTFLEPAMHQELIPVLYFHNKTAQAYRKLMGAADVPFQYIRELSEAGTKGLNVLNVMEADTPIQLGQRTKEAGTLAVASLERAAADLRAGLIDVLVTAPIDKHSCHLAGFAFAGHTEFLADLFQVKDQLMILISEQMKVATVTGHVPVSQVHTLMSQSLLADKYKLLVQSLQQDFCILKPRIAVLGLNPHAGEQGSIGDEEEKIIIPALEKLREEGHLAMGPFPADGFFASGAYRKYDAVLAMYHDQGLTPFKSLSYEGGVNYTAGLPAVRTSPDHGTAYDIAGKWIADPSAFRKAIFMGIDIFQQRKQQAELRADPLKISTLRRDREGLPR